MTEKSYILEIPIQKVKVGIRIEFEHPLSRPGQALIIHSKNGAYPGNLTPALERLYALTSKSDFSKSLIKKNVPTHTLIRDRILGNYWPIYEIREDIDVISNLPIKRLEMIDKGDINPESNVSEMIIPILNKISKQAGLEKEIVSKHSRLTSYNEFELEFVRTRIRLETRKDGSKKWIHDEGPFQDIIRQVVSSIPGFEPIAAPEIVATKMFEFAPEIKALKRIREAKSLKSKIEEAIKITTELPDQIESETIPRLESIQSFVGSSRDMWIQARKVISSSEEYCLLLSSFTNEKQSKFTSEQIQDARSNSRNGNLIISVGEPDRTESSSYMEKSEQYISELMDTVKDYVSVIGGVAAAPTHAKVVVSDSGMLFITTCNLLSSDPTKFVLESGFLIDDVQLSSKIVELILEESWIPKKCNSEVEKLRFSLSMRDFPKADTTILREKLEKSLKSLKSGGRKAAFGLVALDNQLQKIAERPRYRLIKNLENRDVLINSVESFSTRLVLASDGLREKGLDKATIKSIIKRCKDNKNREIRIQIWWGRDAPDSKPYNEAGKRERKQAISRLKMFRQSQEFHFYPKESNKPMQNHAKMIIIDDTRILLTSDNLLAFGDTESSRGDAGELGILIDQPRISRYTRGQMELWLPEGRDPRDRTRWAAALGEEVELLSQSPFTSVKLDTCLEKMMNRILNNKDLLSDWNESFKGEDPYKIMQYIMNNGWNNIIRTIGLFHISGKGASNFNKIFPITSLISLAGNPIWRELNEEENRYEKNLKRELKREASEVALSSKISPEIFTKELFLRVKNPDKWTTFTGPYSKLISEMPEFNLKARKIIISEYMKECPDVEVEIRDGHPWIRRRRG